jgi:hypothetical protein
MGETIYFQVRQEDGGGKAGKMSACLAEAASRRQVCKETLVVRPPSREKSNYLSVMPVLQQEASNILPHTAGPDFCQMKIYTKPPFRLPRSVFMLFCLCCAFCARAENAEADLYDAIHKNDTAQVRKILAKGVTLTEFHFRDAIQNKDSAILSILLT